VIWLDTETFSEVPIKHGTYKYAENAEVMIVTYAFADDDPVQCWDVTSGKPMPGDLEYMLLDTDEPITAHNAMFDRAVTRISRNMKLKLDLQRWRCTMVRALAHSLPGALGALCEILQVDQDKQKLKTGRDYIHLFCKPRPKNAKIRRADRTTHPVEWAGFLEYARYDIEAMRVVARKLPAWNYRDEELALWHLDQRINDRGFAVDVDLATAAIRAVDRAQKGLAARTVDLTGGEVCSATQRDKLLTHILAAYGVDLPDMQSSTLERRIQDPDLPLELRELLAVRLQSCTSSVSKYRSLLNGVSDDGRLHGTLQFNGALRTGRWAGRVFQPHNLMRPTLKQHVIDDGIESILADVADLVTDNVMELAANAMRGSIIAPPGKKLVVADLANIEGRMLAWLAGEGWKLKAFADYDQGIGSDLYKLAYAKAFRVEPESVEYVQRQIGKVMELMLGYEGGVGAFVTGAATYGFDIEEMAEGAFDTLPGDVTDEAAGFLEWTVKQKRPTFGLSDRAFIVCDSFKRLWRRAHPMTVDLWAAVKEAVQKAVYDPGKTFTVRLLKVGCDGAWLRIRLPSGRYLCYPSPRVANDGQISYMGVSQYSRKWTRLTTYGGKLVENITQAAARDVLAQNMQPAEAAGYELVLTVHDEYLTETPDTDAYTSDGLCAIMATNPPWAGGLPLAASGFECRRYRKD
jgi:DNA polymerase